MRSGLTFIAASMALAWILTAVAVAAPLTDAWRGMDVVWNDARGRLEGVAGAVGPEVTGRRVVEGRKLTGER